MSSRVNRFLDFLEEENRRSSVYNTLFIMFLIKNIDRCVEVRKYNLKLSEKSF